MGFPGKAEYWFNRTVQQEPLLFDQYLYTRIIDARTDSLMNAHAYGEVIEVLSVFLDRFERTGMNRQIEISRSYLRLGSAYHALGDVENAIMVWRQGIGTNDQYYYPDYTMTMMAESLHVHDVTFTDDSLAAYAQDNGSMYSPDGFYDIARVVYGAIFGIAVWFGIGFCLMVVMLAGRSQQQGEEPVGRPRVAVTAIVVRFLLFVLLPCMVVPAVFAAIGFQIYIMHYLFVVLCGAGGVIGIALALFDGRRFARREQVSMNMALRCIFAPLWLSVAVVLALGVSTIIGLASFAFLLP